MTGWRARKREGVREQSQASARSRASQEGARSRLERHDARPCDGAHVEASRFDFLVTTYLATARRLEDRESGPREPLSNFINDCEDIIATENLSWIAKWTKPSKV